MAVLLSMVSAAACAQCSHTDFLHDLGMRESRLDPNARNPFGFVGIFQMGEAAGERSLGVGDKAAVGDMAEPIAVGLDQTPAGRTETRVEAQDSHG